MDERLEGLEYLFRESGAGRCFAPEDLTDEQRQLGAIAEKFAREEVVPAMGRIDAGEHEVVARLLRRSGELGLLGTEVPEAYGGLALDKATNVLLAERLGHTGSFAVAFMAHTGIGTLPLVYYGTDAQKARYLPGLVDGTCPAAYCLTEPNAGSDALGARTRATRTPDGGWTLEGTKQFITNGGFAGLYTIFARIDGERFTGFLAERGTPGLTVGAEEKKLGIKGSSTTQLVLEDARLPAEGLLGEPGQGHKIAFNVLNVGRFKLGAVCVGAAKGALGEGIRYAALRKQFGVPIARFGAIREKLADSVALTYAAEAVAYRVAGLLDARLAEIDPAAPDASTRTQAGVEAYAAECAIAKVFCSEALADVADEVLQIHGGYGFTQEYAAERYYRDERINRIFEGTNEINRLLLPATLLRRSRGDALGLAEARAVEAAAGEPSGALGPERRAVASLKAAFLAVLREATGRFGGKVKDEQEVLLALADVAIQVFAAESAILRAERRSGDGEGRRALHLAAAQATAFRAFEAGATAARRALCLAGARHAPAAVARLREIAYLPAELREAKRRLADAALAAEAYPF
jgi:butyryl-CoA dehydrogenase